MRAYRIIGIIAILLQGCGGGDDSRYDRMSRVAAWQSYTASPEHAIHYWDSKIDNARFEITKLPRFSNNFHSGYAFVSGSDLVFINLMSSETFALQSLTNSIKPVASNATLNTFTTKNNKFYHSDSKVWSCHRSGENCQHIEIHPGTFPYVYAENNGKVIAVTNWGDALMFDGATWCRMARSSADVFNCDPSEPLVTKPREIQFYSSIQYQGKTLLGEWPTGNIYEFDGQTLAPSAYWTPPTLRARARVGYEAQSLGEYCGDLYIGYWPRGELWRYNGKSKDWSYFHRFFTDRTPGSFIPYKNREPDALDPAFFGQRITSLTPFKDSLYVTTSNLRDWPEDVVQNVLNDAEVDEYGSVYRIYREGCETRYQPSSN